MVKRPYLVKVKAKKSFTNIQTGRKFKKGKTYTIRFGSESAKLIRGRRNTREYKILSVRKKPVKT